jgi:hypothetical protein
VRTCFVRIPSLAIVAQPELGLWCGLDIQAVIQLVSQKNNINMRRIKKDQTMQQSCIE